MAKIYLSAKQNWRISVLHWRYVDRCWPVGFDGSSCIHQFLKWAENLTDSVNFILIFNKGEHQRWARIAFGTAFPLTYYEGLYSSSRTQIDKVNFVEEFIKSTQKVSYNWAFSYGFLHVLLDVQLMLSQIIDLLSGTCLESH